MKMNMSMSMGFLKPVKQFFKKYTALLPSIGITIAALLILPVTLMVGGSVKEQMQSSVRTAGTMASLLREVPSKDTPGQVKRYMDQMEEEANQIKTLAIESSMRQLISYDVFPPKGTSSQLYVAFGKKYRAAVEEMVSRMNALDAPNDAEIRSQTGADARAGAGVIGEGRGQAARNIDVEPMIDALCLKRAQEISVYAHPSAFPWYDFWKNYDFAGQQQALRDCWDSQVIYWICKDIASTISVMNEGSAKVFSSPVKRLMAISFTAPTSSGQLGDRDIYQGDFGGMRESPNYILPPSAASISTGMMSGILSNFVTASLTNRSCDEEADIIHFAFSVLVDNRYVMAFMEELCSEKQHTWRVGFKEDGEEKTGVHNQITILDLKVSAIDKADTEHEFYRYGNGAVMRLDLICEYQFCREGYDAIKPDSVKQTLNQGQTDGQTPTAPTPPIRSINRGMRSPL